MLYLKSPFQKENPMPSYQPGSDTRNRLLVAAAEVFAEQGFRHARISDICERAQANIAAVNYHFGDKESLYLAVVQKLDEESKADAPYMRTDPVASAEQKLHTFVREFLGVLLKTGPSTWLGKLMAREMMEPTAALDYMIKNVIPPVDGVVRGIVAELLSLPAESPIIQLCVSSILSQCMIYFDTKEIALRMMPGLINPDRSYEPATITFLAEHITQFSLHGMHAMAHKPECEAS
jgi:AcrR family transcriptional regulator